MGAFSQLQACQFDSSKARQSAVKSNLQQLKSKTMAFRKLCNLFSRQAKKAALNETTANTLQIISNDERPEPTVNCKTLSSPTGNKAPEVNITNKGGRRKRQTSKNEGNPDTILI